MMRWSMATPAMVVDVVNLPAAVLSAAAGCTVGAFLSGLLRACALHGSIPQRQDAAVVILALFGRIRATHGSTCAARPPVAAGQVTSGC